MFMDKKKLIFAIFVAVSIFGIFLSGMLTAAKYSDTVAILCGEDVDNSCNKVQNSEFSDLINLKDENNSTTFKVPLSLAGVFFYLTVLGLSIFMALEYKKKKQVPLKHKYIMLGLCVAGVSFSIVFVLIQAFLIEAFCTYCIYSAIDTLILLFLSFFLIFV